MQYIWIYIGLISLIAVVITLHDKHAAKRRSWRVKERTLLLVSALGGSVAMLLTMRAIRHKTRHSRFMVGIPVMILLQFAAVAAILWWRTRT